MCSTCSSTRASQAFIRQIDDAVHRPPVLVLEPRWRPLLRGRATMTKRGDRIIFLDHAVVTCR